MIQGCDEIFRRAHRQPARAVQTDDPEGGVAAASGRLYAGRMRVLAFAVFTLALAPQATAEWRRYEAICVPKGVAVNNAHWHGPLRQTQEADEQDADRHRKRFPAHPVRASVVLKDHLDDL
jgi:hypothetical protein